MPSKDDFTRRALGLVDGLLGKLLGLLSLVLRNLALLQYLVEGDRDLAGLDTLLYSGGLASVNFVPSDKSLRIGDWQSGDCGRERESDGDDAGETHFEYVVDVLSEVKDVKVLMSWKDVDVMMIM